MEVVHLLNYTSVQYFTQVLLFGILFDFHNICKMLKTIRFLVTHGEK